jgi:transcriptional regulator with XRE-family HTH domain
MAKSFGQALRELRRSKDITQRDLSKGVGVDFSYISKVENDRLPPPSADTIVKICEVLEVSPDELLALTGKMPTEVKEMISANRAVIKFIRKAHAMGLTDEEWEKLTQRLKRLRSG